MYSGKTKSHSPTKTPQVAGTWQQVPSGTLTSAWPWPGARGEWCAAYFAITDEASLRLE